MSTRSAMNINQKFMISSDQITTSVQRTSAKRKENNSIALLLLLLLLLDEYAFWYEHQAKGHHLIQITTSVQHTSSKLCLPILSAVR